MNTPDTTPASSTEEDLGGTARNTARSASPAAPDASSMGHGDREAATAAERTSSRLQRAKAPCLTLLRTLVLWIPQLSWAAVIIVLSLHSQKSLAPYASALSFPYADKVMHLMEYGVFGILTVRAVYMDGRWLTFRRTLVAAAVFCSLFGVLDEYVQSFAPGRESCSPGDWLADTAGGFLGAWVWMVSLSGIVRKIHGGGGPLPPGPDEGQAAKAS